MNSYVPNYVSNNLKWYERDSLSTWYDECKCQDFLRDADNHFKQGRVINFDIIHKICRGEEISKSKQDSFKCVSNRQGRYLFYFEKRNNKETFCK